MRVLILTEGYSHTGYGHISRCTAIAQVFRERNANVTFIVNGDESVKNLVQSYPLFVFNWLENTERLLEYLSQDDIIVIDSYLAGKGLYTEIRQRVKVAAYLDDFNRLEYPEGIIINGTVGAELIPYKRNFGQHYLLGKDFVILREAFKDLCGHREIREKVKTVLITFGGSDPLNLTPKILEKLTNCYANLRKIVILGPAFSHKAEIERMADDNTVIYRNVEAEVMRDLMLAADFAISAAGQTINELAITGLPSVIFKVAENQGNNIAGWKNIGFVDEFIDATKDWHIDDLDKIILKFENSEYRREIFCRGISQIDGKGAHRIMKAVIRMFYEMNMDMRLAKEEDLLPLFELTNDRMVRQNSFSTHAISLDEHRNWFYATLKNRARRLFVFYEKEKLIGQVRFDIEENNSAVISISIGANYRGFGLAPCLLEKALRHFHDRERQISKIYAYVKTENMASRYAFIHAGFKDCVSDNKHALKYCYVYGN